MIYEYPAPRNDWVTTTGSSTASPEGTVWYYGTASPSPIVYGFDAARADPPMTPPPAPLREGPSPLTTERRVRLR